MAETVDKKIRLPEGKTIKIRVPSDWDSSRIEQELVNEGVLEPKQEGSFLGGVRDSLADIPGAAAKGVEKGLEETARTLGDLRESAFSNAPFLKHFDFLGNSGPFSTEEITKNLQNTDVPDMGHESTTTTGGLVEGVSQFATGAVLSPVKGGGLVKSAVQGAFADVFAFDPEETKTISTTLKEVPGIGQIIPEALVSQEDDTRWEGKLKNAIEGAGVGITVDKAIQLVRGLKNAFKARKVKEVPPEEVKESVRETLALPAPEREFSVDSAGRVKPVEAPNNVRAEGQRRQVAERRDRVGVSRQESDAARAREVIEGERKTAFDSIQAKEKAVKDAQVEAAWKEKLAQEQDAYVEDLMRKSTLPPKFRQGGQVNPEVFREGLAKLYRGSADLFEFTKKGKKEFGPHFEPAAESLYRSIRAELGESEAPVVRETVGGYNPNKFNTEEEIKEYTDELIHKHGQSREIKSWEDVKRRAQELGMSRKQILRLRDESKNWTARIKAAHDAALDSWEATQKAAIKAVDGTPEDLVTFYEKMYEDAELLNSIVGIRSEAGRVLNSLKMMAESRGEVSEQFRKFLDEQGGEASLRSIADKVSQAKPSEARRIMRRTIKEPTLLDAILEYQINWGFLSGPQTHVVNFLSNGVVQGLSVPEMYTTSLVGKITRSADRQSFSQANKYAQGFQQSGLDAVKSAWKTIGSDDPIIVAGNREIQDTLGKLELEAHKAWKANTFNRYIPNSVSKNVPDTTKQRLEKFVDKTGSAVRLPGKALYVGDAFWKTFGYRTKLNQLAQEEVEKQIKSGRIKGDEASQVYQNIINNPSKEIHDLAMDNARYRTFTRELGSAGKKLQSLSSDHPSVKFVIPFMRTPINIFKYATERTPFGIALKETREAISKGGRARDEAISKMLVGSSIGSTAIALAYGGKLTGGAPRDPQSRANFYESGRQPNSIRVGDKWVSYARIEPLASVMGTAANLAQAWDYMSSDEQEKASAALGMALGELVINKTFMESLGSLIQSATEPEKYGDKWLRNMLSSIAVPNLAAQVARDVDPHLKQMETIMDAVNARTPWNRDQVTNKLNRWGEPIEYGGNMVNPMWDSSATDSKFLKNMYKNDIQVGMPSDKIMGVELSPRLYNKYVKFGRIGARRQLEHMYDTSNIANQSPEIQERIIRKTVNQWDNLARQKMLPLIKEEVIERKRREARALVTPEKENIKVRAE